MRAPRTAYARLSTQLTEADEALLRRAKDSGAAASLSDALDKALRGFLERPELAASVTLPARQASSASGTTGLGSILFTLRS